MDSCGFITCMAFLYIYDSTMIYIIGNQLTHYFIVFVVLARIESQGNSYKDVERFYCDKYYLN